VYNGAIDIYVPGTYHTGTIPVNDGNWHFVGYSWSIALQQLKLWVDGTLDASFTVDLTSSTTDLVSVGQEYDDLVATNHFNGSIAEISVWNEVLSAQEIAELMTGPIDTNHLKYNNLVGSYNIRSGCKGQLKDRASFQNHGSSCQVVDYGQEVLDGFANSDYDLTWYSDLNGLLSDTSTASFVAQQTQTVSYTANDGYGTQYYDSIFIAIYPHPITSAIAGNDTVGIGLTEIYQVTGASGSTYSWMATGGTIDVGNGTESIAVTWPAAGTGLLEVVETDTNGCMGDTVSLAILVVPPTALEEGIVISPVVFPNPFTHRATLHFSNFKGTPFTLVIYNSLGNKVYVKRSITENQVVLDRKDFSRGLFLYELKNEKEIYYGRVVVE
jgi:hypothetical protein